MKIIDLTGKKFGKLTVLKKDGKNKHGQIKWLCRCECGAITSVNGGKLRIGHTKSCGCLHGQGKGAIKSDGEWFNDLSGKKYGRLTVISRAENGSNGETKFLCQCECGKYSKVSSQSLVRGTTVSCGCFIRDVRKTWVGNKNPSYKHGRTRKHPLWDTYHHMAGRCYRPKDKSFKSYGGRGISMCRIWRKNIEAFFEWAFSHGYADGLEIDRINNNGPYAPWNCQFISKEENLKKRFKQRLRWLPM